MPKSIQGNTSKNSKMSFWEYLAEVVTEPIILAFASFVLFNHINNIWGTSPDFATFWIRLNERTSTNMLVFLGFLSALTIWALVKALRLRREFQKDKELKEMVRTNSEDIKQIAESVEKLAMAIKDDAKNKG
jgi:hypothetical protein